MNRRFRLSALTAGVLALVLLSAAGCFPPTPTPASNAITGIVWEWTSVTDQSTKQTESIPNPESYTLILNTDGTLSGKADCNTFTGTTAQENGLVITLGATSMAYCGDASLDQKYLQLLSRIVAGGPDGQGNLALETGGGAQRMLFRNGGPAPK